MAQLARTIPAYNSTNRRTMDVLAYSGYAGLGLGSPSSTTYFGDLRQKYGVDWEVLTSAGLTVAMAGYGHHNITATKQLLLKGSNITAGHTEKEAPLLVCGAIAGTQAEFAERYRTCDGAMEYDGAKTFDMSLGFHVPSLQHAGRGIRAATRRIVYMRSNGSDRHSGISNSVAVRTLTRVHMLVREMIVADPYTDIEVHIAPGTYRSHKFYDYRVKWPSNDTMQHATITFMPAPAPPSPVLWPVTFDGCNTAVGPCPGGTFFDIFFSVPRKDGATRATNLIFRGLHMTNFSQGIVFTGCEVIAGHCANRSVSHHEHNTNGGAYALSSNTIRDCWFERMGNVFNTSLCPCCGAIATVHTHNSLFTGNIFTDVVGIQRGIWPPGAKKPDPGWYVRSVHIHTYI